MGVDSRVKVLSSYVNDVYLREGLLRFENIIEGWGEFVGTPCVH